ncbi:MAG: hypothetical protein ACOCP8_01450 [archaeon]
MPILGKLANNKKLESENIEFVLNNINSINNSLQDAYDKFKEIKNTTNNISKDYQMMAGRQIDQWYLLTLNKMIKQLDNLSYQLKNKYIETND